MKIKPLYFILCLLILSGCANTSPELAVQEVQDSVQSRSGLMSTFVQTDTQQQHCQKQIDQQLASVLTQEAALQIALCNAPTIQAHYAQLGVHTAEYNQAIRLNNPSLSLTSHSNTLALEAMWQIVGLIMRPSRQAAANFSYTQQKDNQASALLAEIKHIRQRYIDAVTQAELHAMQSRIYSNLEIANTLTQAQYQAGTISARDLAKQELFTSTMHTQQLITQNNADSARAELALALGLSPAQSAQLNLPTRLTIPPSLTLDSAALEESAWQNRLDVKILQNTLQQEAQRANIALAQTLLDGMQIGLAYDKTGKESTSSAKLELTLPLFNQGQDTQQAANARLQELSYLLRAKRQQIHQEIQHHYRALQLNQTLLKQQRDRILPLHKQILEETKRYYNGMLEGIYTLLEAQREQVEAGKQLIEAEQNYCLAYYQLEQSVSIPLAKIPNQLTSSKEKTQ